LNGKFRQEPTAGEKVAATVVRFGGFSTCARCFCTQLRVFHNLLGIFFPFLHSILASAIFLIVIIVVVQLKFHFSPTAKESWIVNHMIDYFAQTNSYRVFEVLVKVQSPHDVHIFNKLHKCLQESNQSQKRIALTLFGQLVRKHPTWLHKVVSHGFLKELLKLLKVSTRPNAQREFIDLFVCF
jgi:Hamartin protein